MTMEEREVPFQKTQGVKPKPIKTSKMGHSPCLELSSSLAFKRSSSFRRSCSSGDEKKDCPAGKILPSTDNHGNIDGQNMVPSGKLT